MKNFFPQITISFIIGLIYSYYNPCEIYFIIGLIIFIMIINIKTIKEDRIYVLIVFLLLGIFVMEMSLTPSDLMVYKDEEVNIIGKVKEKKYIEEEMSNYIIQVTEICYEENIISINEKLRLKVIGEKALTIGDVIEFKGKIKEPMGKTNPKLYDFKSNLETQKVRTIMSVKSQFVKICDNKLGFFEKIQQRFIDSTTEIIDEFIVSDNKNLIKAMILGEYSYLDENQILIYRDLGLSHILAVSGLHIGILIAFIMSGLACIGIKRKFASPIALIIIWIYGYLIGFPPSILRANIMFSILTMARSRYMPYNSLNSLFLSMFILLIYNPFYINSLGFQLSYIAALSIILGNKKVKELFYPMNNKIFESLFILIALLIGMNPIQSYYFNEVPLLGIIANLIIVPIISGVLILSFILLLTSYFSVFLSKTIGIIISVLLNIVNYLENSLSNLSFLNLRVRSPEITEIILFYIILYCLSNYNKILHMSFKMKRIIFSFFIIYVLIFNIENMKEIIEIHFIDVGQGDSILIRGRKDYLIDTGGSILENSNIPDNITIPYLKKHGVFKLDGLFLTHFHEDHVEGVPQILKELNVNKAYVSYSNKENEGYISLIDSNVEMNILRKDDIILLEEKFNLFVLSPKLEYLDKGYSENNLSLVLMLKYGDNSILLTGDAEKEVEEELIRNYNLNQTNLLKLGHHGSSTSSTDNFLNSVNPDAVVICVGRNNLYGHPNEEVLKRLNKIPIYRTDEDGRIKVLLSEDKMKINAYLKPEEINNFKMWLYIILNIIMAYEIIWIYNRDRFGGINGNQGFN